MMVHLGILFARVRTSEVFKTKFIAALIPTARDYKVHYG
jgi:hypothetical protein